MYQTTTQIRVRYGETDRMGYVYYGNFAMYFEVGRTEMLRTLGFTYKEWEDSGILLPVRSLNIKYRSPAFYDDLLTITTTVKELPDIKISFDYRIHNEKNQVIALGQTVLVFIDARSRQLAGPPENFLVALKEKGHFS